MARYIAKSYLLHEGSVVKDGNELELTEEQANRLGAKVVPVVVEEAVNNEQKPLEDYTVPELKKLAEKANIEGYKDMKKEELITALESE